MPPAEEFTAEQEAIVELPVDARAIVDSPAGTGKTHVLAGRLTRLVDRDGLSAGDEVVVLSFSRAAVAELKARVRGLGGDARYVGAATFDSFASRLLATEDPGGAWLELDYERRIEAATDLLQAERLPQALTLVRHVLVDELQDVVGSRANLVLALLQRLDPGFTLFGDPAQAIYGHRVRDGGLNTDRLYESIARAFEKSLSRWTMTRDFRSSVSERSAIARIGDRLRSTDPVHHEIEAELRSVYLRLTAVTLGAARRMLVRQDAGLSAILCRTNAQAHRVSRLLFEHSIPHRYQRRGEEKAAVGWLSRALLKVSEQQITRAELLSQLEQFPAASLPDEGDAFALLRKLDPARGEAVDLRRVADRLRSADIPEEANEVVAAPVVVSTIHRAKGLEFDRVLLCDRYREDGDVAEENRLRYVGLTRARKEIFHLDPPDTAGLVIDRATGRWVRRGFGKNRWRVFEIEVLGPDTDRIYPAGTFVFEDDARIVQEYLAERVAPGDPVHLELAPQKRGEDSVPRYVISHESRPVAVTSDSFASALGWILSNRKAPRTIRGLHVEMIDSVAGDTVAARRSGLGTHGIWARVRVFGLGVLEWVETDLEGA